MEKKKVLFISDWDYTPFWEKVARLMVKQSLLKGASTFVVGRNFYDELVAKKDHPFESVYLMQDALEDKPGKIENLEARLKRLQDHYNEHSLWRYVWADRSWVFNSYEENIKRLILCFEYFEGLYDKEKPDLILTNAYASMVHLIIYEVARKKGIAIVRPLAVRMGGKYTLSDSEMEEETWVRDLMNNKQQISEKSFTDAKTYIQQFRKRAEQPDYQKLKSNVHAVTTGHFYRFFRYIYRFYFAGVFKGDHTKKNPWQRLVHEISWRQKRKKLSRQDFWDAFDAEKEKYIYFPLHVQPEMSTMTYAPFYLDQLSVIENIAKSMPLEYRLVVKEHPSMLGLRDMAYYERLRKIPNVKLIYPFYVNFKLLGNTSLIMTITGTAGLEGMILKKPVIAFGSIFFNQCPLLINAKDVPPTQWRERIDHALTRYEHKEEVLENFIAAVFQKSFDGNYEEPLFDFEGIMSDSNLNLLISHIVDRYYQKT